MIERGVRHKAALGEPDRQGEVGGHRIGIRLACGAVETRGEVDGEYRGSRLFAPAVDAGGCRFQRLPQARLCADSEKRVENHRDRCRAIRRQRFRGFGHECARFLK